MSLVRRFESTSAPVPITPLNAGRTSVEELYKKWLPELTQGKMKSKDLLDQILVCYTIKRALNGDQKAVDKLYSLYESAAIRRAEKMAKKRRINMRAEKLNISKTDDISETDDISHEAKRVLYSLISGSKPEYIINSLLAEDSEHSKIPLSVEIFFFWYYSDYVPKEIDKIMKRQPGKLDGLDIDYFLNPVAIIDAYTFWQNSPKRARKFNSDSFRPNKETNLTTWLLGTETNYMQGKLCQLISDEIDSYWKMKEERGSQQLTKDDLLHEEVSNNSGKMLENSLGKQRPDMTDEEVKQAIELICKRGISKRDAEIFVKNQVQKCSKVELAQEYDLSRMTIHRICKKISSKFSPLP
jgi:hypothetical protein